jgi:hypothetical protein
MKSIRSLPAVCRLFPAVGAATCRRGTAMLLIVPVAAVFAAGPSHGAELRVPAATAYLSPNVRGVRVSARSGITGWKEPQQRTSRSTAEREPLLPETRSESPVLGDAPKVLWFGQINTPGQLHCGVQLRLSTGLTSRLRLTVAGQSHEASVTGAGEGKAVTADFGRFDIAQTGYCQFRLESLNPSGAPCGDLDALLLDGPAAAGAHFNLKPRRNAASVHLMYPLPKGIHVSAFYCEVTAVEDPLWTYYMACGWHRGYFGMQVNSPTERRIIFSVWDSGNEARDRGNVAQQDRVELVAKGKGVSSGSFGNEGTGGHSHLVYPWKTGVKQRFLVTAKPVDATHTVYSGFYYRHDTKRWMLISSWRAPKEGGYLRGLYSFSENFGGSNGHLLRKALYGNQWIRDDQGRWTELTTAKFSHDTTGRNDRLDRFMGVEQGQFFLSHGGFVPGFTKFGTEFQRPATGQSPADIVLPKVPELQ